MNGAAELPQAYAERMKALLGEEYEAYLSALADEPTPSLRINTLKWTREEAFSTLSLPLAPVPWAPDGFYYPSNKKPAKSPAYHAGLYYLQEASAMSPGEILPVEKGDRILDLCAAPGGKATQLAARLSGTGVLYANDISASRAQALLKNLERAGAANIFVTAETPERLAEIFSGYFDKILVDAPCSGEGMFRKDGAMFADWLAKGPSHYQPVQAQILREAYRMLAPGGCLLYSTCTFSREENEGNIEAFLRDCPDMELVPVGLRLGFSEGFLPGTVRIWPHRAHGEGHFLALMKRRGERMRSETHPAGKRARSHGSKEKLPEFAIPPSFLTGKRIVRRENLYYAIPEGEEIHPGIRYLRTGLLLGEQKKKFIPSQALAMALPSGDVPNRIHLPWNDERAVRYLKGETLDLSGLEICGGEGNALVCLERFPLGWGARRGLSLKNRYPAGWRWL